MNAQEPAPPVPASQMKLGGAVFLGVGAMVGAGIFALLGEAGAVAGSAVWVSFLIGGVVAALLGYTVTKLSVRFPSRGGLVSFLARGFGDSHLTGVSSWLFYMSGMIVTAMVSLSFGSYAVGLLLPDDADPRWAKVFMVVVVVAMALVNRIGADAVGKLQSLIVVVLLVVFAIFIVATLKNADFSMLKRETYPSARAIISAVALTFFAYLGFAVIANTAESMPRPERNVPLATYLALAITGGLYILMSVGVFGAMSVEEVVAAGDTALAKAAEPSLGSAGFTMMSIAALLATASSVNANAFAAQNLTANLADSRQFPPVFGGPSRVFGTRGLAISVLLIVLLGLFFDLSAIASIGSAVALAIFALVGVAGFRLRKETASSSAIILLAIAVDLFVLTLFMIDTARNEPRTFVSMIMVGVLAVVLDLVWKRGRDRRPVPQEPGATS